MKKSDVHIGDRLTIKTAMSAERLGKCYHGGIIGCVICNQTTYPRYRQIEPGTVGIVDRVDVPAMTQNKSFLCLDFTIDGHVWRLRPWYHEVFPCN